VISGDQFADPFAPALAAKTAESHDAAKTRPGPYRRRAVGWCSARSPLLQGRARICNRVQCRAPEAPRRWFRSPNMPCLLAGHGFPCFIRARALHPTQETPPHRRGETVMRATRRTYVVCKERLTLHTDGVPMRPHSFITGSTRVKAMIPKRRVSGRIPEPFPRASSQRQVNPRRTSNRSSLASRRVVFMLNPPPIPLGSETARANSGRSARTAGAHSTRRSAGRVVPLQGRRDEWFRAWGLPINHLSVQRAQLDVS